MIYIVAHNSLESWVFLFWSLFLFLILVESIVSYFPNLYLFWFELNFDIMSSGIKTRRCMLEQIGYITPMLSIWIIWWDAWFGIETMVTTHIERIVLVRVIHIMIFISWDYDWSFISTYEFNVSIDICRGKPFELIVISLSFHKENPNWVILLYPCC